ncbi:tape measure protein [Lactobacillus sp. UCMA15818]|uniref:phage tail protein n=1 Tax=Lactobacillus sp. UCMA15818 TaxID=2583394 RepID=UPI0025B27554|nr:tape measure protein [Lactobacillus sp. UCMA15818]MDN2452520.1 tape measure protein [Lactobacillus sp. UCMA15818]
MSNVAATFTANISGYTSAMNKMQSATKSMTSKVSGSASTGGKSFIKMGALAGLGASVAVSAFNLIKGGIGSMVSELSNSSATWKTFTQNMQGIGKSSSQIDKVKSSLQSFAQKTIYSSSDMASTYSQLAAVGTKSTLKLVKGFGGLASAAENPQQAMKTLSQQATQMAAKPMVQWQDFKLMLEQTPAGIAAVAKTMGISTAQLVKNVQEGKVSTQDFFAAVAKTGTNKTFTKMAEQYKTVGQAMDGLKETLTNKLQPAFNKVSQYGINAISSLIDYVGTIDFTSMANKLISDVKSAWNTLKSIVSWVQSNSDWLLPLATSVVTFVATFNTITKVIQIINSIKTAATALFTVLSANPIVAIIALVAALVAGLVVFFTQTKTGQQLWSSFTSFLSSAWQGLVSIAQTVWSAITTAFSTAVTTIKSVWSGITSFFSALWNGIVTAVSPITSAIVNLWNAAVALIEAVWQGLVSAASAIWNAITPIIQVVVTAIEAVWQTLTTIWSAIWNTIVSVVTAIWNTIKTVVTTAFNVVKTIITTVLSTISTVWSTQWNVIKTVVSTIWNVIKTVISTVINAIADILKAILSAIQGNWSSVWNNLKAAATTIWNGIKSVLTTIWNGIKSVASSIWNGIKSVISTIWNGIKSVVTSVANGIKSTVTSIWNGIKSVTSTVWNGIKSITSSIWNGLKSTVVNAGKAVINGIHSAWNGVVSWASGLWNSVKSVIRSALSFNLWDAGKAIMNSFLHGLKSVWGSITSFVGNIASWIRKHKGPISYDKKLLIPAGQAIMGGFNKSLQNAFSEVQSNVSSMASQLANTVADSTAAVTAGDLNYSTTSDVAIQPIDSSEQKDSNIYVSNEIVGDKIYTSVKTNEARKTNLSSLKLGGS